jgi:uncharacterized membrane protein
MSSTGDERRPTVLAGWLIVAGVIGWVAAFTLLTERIHLLANPGATASCDLSVLIQCGKNLDSWQGAVFGFPNPILGVAGWVAPIVVGVAILAGARFARWFWMLFTLGLAGAFAFSVWLIAQSIYALGTLCPWCMVTWAVVIPTFYAVLLHVLRTGLAPVPAGVRRAADTLVGWLPVLVVVSFAVIAVLAQLRLDVLGSIF